MKGKNAVTDILKDVNGIKVTEIVEEAVNVSIFIRLMQLREKFRAELLSNIFGMT